MTRNLFYSSLSAGSAALMLLLLSLAGKRLGADDYGAFTIAINLATIAEVFMDFGLHQITIRAIARDATVAGRFLHTSVVLKILPGALMVAIFGIVALFLRPEADVRLACLLMLMSATMRSYLLTARGVLQGLERFGHDALVTTMDRVLLLVACGVALWLGASVVQLSLVFLIVRIVTAGGALVLARGHAGPGRLDRELWRRLPAEAIPVGLFLLVLNLYNRIDTLMLGRMVGLRDAGIYGAAYPVYEGLTYATAVISAVLVPRLSRLWHGDAAQYRRLVTQGLLGSVATALVVAVVAWPLAAWGVALVFGDGYEPAATSLRYLLLGLPFVYVIWVLHAVALAADKMRVLLWVTAAGTILNIVLNLVLIPRASYNGSAIATVISEGVAMCLLFYGLRGALRGQASPQAKRLDG